MNGNASGTALQIGQKKILSLPKGFFEVGAEGFEPPTLCL